MLHHAFWFLVLFAAALVRLGVPLDVCAATFGVAMLTGIVAVTRDARRREAHPRGAAFGISVAALCIFLCAAAVAMFPGALAVALALASLIGVALAIAAAARIPLPAVLAFILWQVTS